MDGRQRQTKLDIAKAQLLALSEEAKAKTSVAVLAERITLNHKMADTDQKGIYCPNCGLWNGPERKSCSKCGTPLSKKGLDLKDKTAIVALIIAFFSILLGTWQAIQVDKVAHTNVKPLLDIKYQDFVDEKGQTLSNYGLGPAVITNVRFYKNDRNSENIYDFIDLPYNAKFDTAYDFGDYHSYIQEDQAIDLAKLTSDHLKGQEYNNTQIQEIMKAWTENLSGIVVEIDYEDVLGQKQETLSRSLGFRG